MMKVIMVSECSTSILVYNIHVCILECNIRIKSPPFYPAFYHHKLIDDQEGGGDDFE